jgi:hypothetical protein
MIELYLAASQAGMYLVPINHGTWRRRRSPTSCGDSEAKVLVAGERFADTVTRPRTSSASRTASPWAPSPASAPSRT